MPHEHYPICKKPGVELSPCECLKSQLSLRAERVLSFYDNVLVIVDRLVLRVKIGVGEGQ